MPKKIGIGVVGLDHWYTAFGVLGEANRNPATRLVAIADKSRPRLSEVGEKHRADYVTTNFSKVIADPNVDLICSLLNTRDSVGVTRRALMAGKHVACVKPMAMTLRQADALIELAEQKKRVLWSFDQLGRAGASPQLKALLKRGGIGRPLTYYLVAQSGLPKAWPDSTDPGWWIDDKLVPVGAWADHAIYTIDTLRCLFDAEVETVHGEIANRVHPRLKVEDWGTATLRFTNGMVAVLENSWTAEGYWPHWTKIVGTKGAVHMDPVAFKEQVMVAGPQGVRPLKVPGRRRGGMMGTLIKLVKSGAAKPSPARESRTNLAVTLAVYKSAKTGRYVRPQDLK
jgi:predicted dehydrogenase